MSSGRSSIDFPGKRLPVHLLVDFEQFEIVQGFGNAAFPGVEKRIAVKLPLYDYQLYRFSRELRIEVSEIRRHDSDTRTAVMREK